MLRRSHFIAATYALSFVFANFGIAIAARMPMMTTTIRSSIRVKPFLVLIWSLLKRWESLGKCSCIHLEQGRVTEAHGTVKQTRCRASLALQLAGTPYLTPLLS